MNQFLKELSEKYPLLGWSTPEVFMEHLESFQLNLVGLSSNRLGFPEVTASAASSISESPVDSNEKDFTRAYFELLERIAVLQAERDAEFSNLFPKSPETALWRYSKSNGVAAHLDWKAACRSARLELLERDAILRSWYFGMPPSPLGGLSDRFSSKIYPRLKASFEIEVFQFKSEVPVVGVFGFPKKDNLPVSLGFGAHETLDGATHHAFQEFYQRLGFTWEEEILEESPLFEPTPLYHLNYYLAPKNTGLIRRWLKGTLPVLNAPSKIKKDREIRIVNLTPENLQGKCSVVKAVSDGLMPLVFGKGHPWLETQAENLFPHPIS